MTIQKEKAFLRDRYKKGYARSLGNNWPIHREARTTWLAWIADPAVQSAYVEGRLDGEKAARLTKLLSKSNG